MDGTPFTVRTGKPGAEEVQLYPVLMCAYGDGPWASKLACACGQTALHGCWRCGIVGSRQAPDGTKLGSTVFGGANAPAPCRTFDLETQTWQEGKVCYAKRTADGADLVLDRDEAARLKTSDAFFQVRANTAVDITLEEQQKSRQRAPGDATPTDTATTRDGAMRVHLVHLQVQLMHMPLPSRLSTRPHAGTRQVPQHVRSHHRSF